MCRDIDCKNNTDTVSVTLDIVIMFTLSPDKGPGTRDYIVHYRTGITL